MWVQIMQKWTRVSNSAGSIPDSYDIYRYLNLVRYSILDSFVVNVISSTYSGATRNDCAMSIYDFSKNYFVMKHSGENKTPNFFSSKIRIFFKSEKILENPIFFVENPIFLENIRNSLESGFCHCTYFSKTYEIRCLVQSTIYWSQTNRLVLI